MSMSYVCGEKLSSAYCITPLYKILNTAPSINVPCKFIDGRLKSLKYVITVYILVLSSSIQLQPQITLIQITKFKE